MIDPNIALSLRPENLGIDTPTQVATATQNLTNLQNVGQLQQQQIQSAQLQNQQRQIQMQQAAALNQAIAANTKQGTDGKYVTDDDGVVKTLAGQGMGSVAQQYRSQQAQLQMQLSQLNDEQLKETANKQEMVDGKLGTILNITDPAKRQAAWNQETQWAYDNKLAQPGSLQQQAPDDQTLQSMLMRSASGRQAVEVETQRRAQQTAAAREADYQQYVQAIDKRNTGYYDRMEAMADNGNWQPAGTQGGKLLLYNRNTGETKLGGPVDADPSGSGQRKQLTPDAALADQRANEKDYEANATAEVKNRETRDALVQAITNGKVYIQPNGHTAPFSSMKQADGSPLSADDVAAYQNDMKQRAAAAQTAIEQSVSNKNNALLRNRQTPGVSTADAIVRYRQGQPSYVVSQQQPASGGGVGATPQQGGGKPPQSAIDQMPVGRTVTFRNGTAWVKNADGSLQQVK